MSKIFKKGWITIRIGNAKQVKLACYTHFRINFAIRLALSQVLAKRSGAKLETLVIDEGFGSLDQDSLELAVRTLMDLQSSGRMIGVISHVSEMKEQISCRIDISKHALGSSIRLVTA